MQSCLIIDILAIRSVCLQKVNIPEQFTRDLNETD